MPKVDAGGTRPGRTVARTSDQASDSLGQAANAASPAPSPPESPGQGRKFCEQLVSPPHPSQPASPAPSDDVGMEMVMAQVDPMSNGAVTSALNAKLKKLTDAFAPQVKRELGYCIQDTDAEWDATFNFSSDPKFLVDCMKKGDLPQRVCTAAELKFYFESILRRGKKNYVRPNKNCNLSSWIDGCEPGWGCTADAGKEVDLQDAENFPSRTVDCQGCCPGFFCPRGLTCMIRT
ncbi:unnamed protein product [Triticum turgidum subsp. durum]|uniref:Uncharacterized protein n=1 Tax=Triticum turgidum subsp. durum TaxID=4567 RepID=A0A9R1AF75_TRITD|nr:unnamed protein product [Triticum turgidum subsp. durum]